MSCVRYACSRQVLEVKCTRPGHPSPSTPYALKVLFNYGHGSATVLTAFEREHAVLSALPPHVNIVRFLREWVERIPDSVHALLPETAKALAEIRRHDGEVRRRKTQFVLLGFHPLTLKQYLRNRRDSGSGLLPWTVLQPMALQLLEGVQHLFVNGVAHLDLKLDNVLVEEEEEEEEEGGGGGKEDGHVSAPPRVIIADLGCAVQLRGSGSWDVPMLLITVRASLVAYSSEPMF